MMCAPREEAPPGSRATRRSRVGAGTASHATLSRCRFLRCAPRDPARNCVCMGLSVDYNWRGEITDAELVALTESHGGRSVAGWWDRIRPFSLGWVTARLPTGEVAGFVNVAWDGCNHAFLLDTKTRVDLQHNGIGTELVRVATFEAKRAGCEW